MNDNAFAVFTFMIPKLEQITFGGLCNFFFYEFYIECVINLAGVTIVDYIVTTSKNHDREVLDEGRLFKESTPLC